MKPKTQSECSWFEDRIEDYLDGGLVTNQSERFQSHLSSCAGCREELEIARRVSLSVRSLPEVECPDYVIQSVFERVRSEETTVGHETSDPGSWSFLRTWFGWTPLALPALAVAIALMVENPSEISVPESIPGNPVYTQAEIREAEYQVKVTMEFIGKVGLKGFRLAGREAIEEGILQPAEKTVVAMLESDALTWGARSAKEVKQ